MASLSRKEDVETSSIPSDSEDEATFGRPVIFPAGLPGFPFLRRFQLVTNPSFTPPFELLASEEDPTIGFYLVDPALIDPDYAPDISEADQTEVGARPDDDLSLRAIVTVGQDSQEATANLAAPLVLNLSVGLGCQAILEQSQYSLRTPLVAGDQ